MTNDQSHWPLKTTIELPTPSTTPPWTAICWPGWNHGKRVPGRSGPFSCWPMGFFISEHHISSVRPTIVSSYVPRCTPPRLVLPVVHCIPPLEAKRSLSVRNAISEPIVMQTRPKISWTSGWPRCQLLLFHNPSKCLHKVWMGWVLSSLLVLSSFFLKFDSCSSLSFLYIFLYLYLHLYIAHSNTC